MIMHLVREDVPLKKWNNYRFSEDYELNNGEEFFEVNEIDVYEIKVA